MTRMQPYVFISYSHADNIHASQISEILTGCEIGHFLDGKDVDWGDDIEEDAVAALIRSSHLLVIASTFSLKSLCVGYEIGYAKALDKTILPFLTYPNLDVSILLSGLSFYTDLGRVESYFKRLSRIAGNPQGGRECERITKKRNDPRTGNTPEERDAIWEVVRNHGIMDALNQTAA